MNSQLNLASCIIKRSSCRELTAEKLVQGVNHWSYVISKTLAREKLAARLLYDYNLGSKQTPGNFDFVKLDCSWLSVLVNQDSIF